MWCIFRCCKINGIGLSQMLCIGAFPFEMTNFTAFGTALLLTESLQWTLAGEMSNFPAIVTRKRVIAVLCFMALAAASPTTWFIRTLLFYVTLFPAPSAFLQVVNQQSGFLIQSKVVDRTVASLRVFLLCLAFFDGLPSGDADSNRRLPMVTSLAF